LNSKAFAASLKPSAKKGVLTLLWIGIVVHIYINTNSMANITIKGTLFDASGIVLSIIVAQGTNILSTHNCTTDFSFSFAITNGTQFTVTINGYTEGSFKFDIQGAGQVNPAAPKTYKQDVIDTYTVIA
jgi:hypothetical protein